MGGVASSRVPPRTLLEARRPGVEEARPFFLLADFLFLVFDFPALAAVRGEDGLELEPEFLECGGDRAILLGASTSQFVHCSTRTIMRLPGPRRAAHDRD